MSKRRHGQVLVVDDDPDVLESSSMLLREHGYTVMSSSNAEDAMQKLQSDSIDAVITDIVMPEVSGIELMRAVHDISPEIPVILMTAYADMEKVIFAIKTGAFDFIVKPFTSDLLIHSVEKAVSYNKLVQMEKDYKRLLEEFNREVETLVAERTMSLMALTVADKIRNPSAVIGLTCKRILEKEEISDNLRKKLQDIRDESARLDKIVQEFQSLFKSRKSMFQYEDINEIVGNIIPVLEGKAAKKGVELSFRPSSSPAKINVQRNLFQIALSHLIKNAIEATTEGGKIDVSITESDNNMGISISDTGLGISKEVAEKIFDPMFSTKDQSFGMGLPLVKQIISEHMGNISLSSTSGAGTEFKLVLPLRWTGNA
jgi:signal transduction histidine kinase